MAEPSVVIIACDAYLAGIYARKFERDGWAVTVAETLDDGEKKASKLRPAIILLDAACTIDVAKEIERLRSMPTLMRTKFVVLAQAGERGQISAAREAGASGYLIFGHFVPQEAVQKMRKLIE